ncbi:ABC transporter ATP-binding protein [Lysinibacillus fusiformis]|uniref:ABC transporter ATP-binding protein n=1 Tax=Lysinibacillus sp. PWR01 TaxID=3342384 RepID=UPI00372D2B52
MFSNLQLIFKGQLKRMYLPIGLSILDTFGTATMYGALYYVIVNIVQGSFTSDVLKLAFMMLIGSFVIRVVFIGFSQYLYQLRGSILIRDARINVSNHLKSLPLGYFSKQSIGKLINICTGNMSDIERVITHLIGDILKITMITTYILSVSFFINPQLAMAQLIMVLLSIPLLLLAGHLGRKNGEHKKDIVAEVLSRVMEYIDGIKVFRAHNQTGEAFKRLHDALKKYRDVSIKVELQLVPVNFLFFIIIDCIVPLVFLVGSYSLLGGTIDAQAMVLFIIISLGISAMFKPFSQFYTEIKMLSVAVNYVASVYKKEMPTYELENPTFTDFDIVFENVKFSYEEGQAVLNDISFTIPAKSTVALIGTSGSGKSTILNVLARFWDIDAGKIMIGGETISRIAPDYLLQNMSIMFQHPFLLNDSIYNNVLIGNSQATRREVEIACQRANCHDFIMAMEQGYETIVGEGGSTLSGGEKQRISLARAFLKDAPIILLDEATASLDPDNEMEIKEVIDELMQGKTVVVIAHKLNTIQNADKILLLKDGQIAEQGTHDELIKLEGGYAQLYHEQLEAKGWKIS